MAYERNAQLEAGRKRRIIAALDRALARQGYKPPPKRAATPSEATQRRRLSRRLEYEGARASYRDLRAAIRAEGGIRPNRDYPSRTIPRELRATRGRGLPPDEMADVLRSAGYHYDGDSELFADIERRRDRLQETHARAREVAAHHNPSEVCTENCRNPRGMFARCENVATRAVRKCRQQWRDAIGRFRSTPRSRR